MNEVTLTISKSEYDVLKTSKTFLQLLLAAERGYKRDQLADEIIRYLAPAPKSDAEAGAAGLRAM
nr:MAG TPA: hypothetical protein [Bacteriophage sp.]